MNEIKPIETYYNGYRFRSRLEARWAVFFDAIGLKYLYENEGMKLSNGDYYLPDFYLPDLQTYVEIKPENAFVIDRDESNRGTVFPAGQEKYVYAAKDISKSGRLFLIAFGDPYNAFPRIDNGKTKCESHIFFKGECVYHVLCMADKDNMDKYECESGEKCAKCEKFDTYVHAEPVLIFADPGKNNTVWVLSDASFVPKNLTGIPFHWFIGAEKVECGKSLSQKCAEGWKKFADAQLKARQARFEYGETPRV